MTCFQLQGRVGEVERVFALTPGCSRVGCQPDSDIVLPVPGVSRAHALLKITAAGVELEDLGSKNGTFVNGCRIHTGSAGPSDEVSFGPVCLTVRVVDPGDARLGLDVGTRAASPSSVAVPSRLDTERHAHRGLRSRLRWLEELDRFQEGLVAAATGSSLSQALGELCRRLDLPALLVMEADPDTGILTVLGAAGGSLPASLGEAEERSLLGKARELAESSETWCWERGVEERSWGWLRSKEGRILLLGAADRAGECPLEPPASRLLLRAIAGRRGADSLSEPRASSGVGPRTVPSSEPGSPGLVFPEGYLEGGSEAMRTVHRELARVAATEVPVLLVGETGVGKELLARTVHLSSPRRKGPFIALNCAAIPDDLLEAELFGVTRGAATDVQARPGLFQAAEGGTLLLDEMGEMPLSLQPKILRALQEREIRPVGGSSMRIDVRIVAATNTDLRQRSWEGRFRSDLYFRLAGAEVEIPPLRERIGDLPGLIQCFVESASQELGRPVRGVTARALEELARDPWQGNVRQLQHVIRRAVLRCPQGGAVDSETLRGLLEPAEAHRSPSGLDLRSHVQATEAQVIRRALEATGGHRTRAAEVLGISRTTLNTKIELYGLAGEPQGQE